METNRLNNFKNHLEQYKEKFTVINEDNLITATSVKFTEPTIEEKELELIKFHQQMLKNNNIQLMNKFKETKRNEIKKYKESHRKKEFNKPITPYRQEIINTLKNPANGFNLALTLNFNPVNLSGLFNLQMVQNKVDEWWKLYCAYKTSPVFTFATANNIRNLPPELLRKGRFDEIFFVDLPDFEERKKILEIHIGKSGRNLANFDLDKLAKMSGEDNYGANIRLAGAEIEAWVKDALMEAYARKTNGEDGADLSMQDFETVIKRMIPMAKMRQEDFKDLRDWANENAVSASVSSATTSNSNDSLGGRRIDLI